MLIIKLKTFNILYKNYIYKDINKKLKNIYNYINTKFAPEPNGYIHLGNLKSFYINLVISKIYNGLNLIKLDDTNPQKEKKFYKDCILKDLKLCKRNCKNNFIKKINYSSFFFIKAIQLNKFFLKKKIINKFNINLFLKGFFKEKEVNLSILIKKFLYKIFRIKYNIHYKIKYNLHIYSMYNYINIICDKFLNIKYSLCSIEFKNYKTIFEWFNNKIFKKIKIYQKEFDRINFINNLTKKGLIFFLKKKKYIKNYKDLRLLNFKTIKISNKNINNLFNLFEKLNLNKNIRKLKLNLINEKFNLKILNLFVKIILFWNKFKNFIYIINFNNKKKNLKINNYILILNFIFKLDYIIIKKNKFIIKYKLFKYNNKKIYIKIKKYNKILLKLIKNYNIIKNFKYNLNSKKIYKIYIKIFKIKKFLINKINKNLIIKISALHDLNV